MCDFCSNFAADMKKLAQLITKIIDFFYRPFDKWVSRQVFRYAVCGGGNLVLDWVLYFITYNFIVGHDLVYFQLSTFHTFRSCPWAENFQLGATLPYILRLGILMTSVLGKKHLSQLVLCICRT